MIYYNDNETLLILGLEEAYDDELKAIFKRSSSERFVKMKTRELTTK